MSYGFTAYDLWKTSEPATKFECERCALVVKDEDDLTDFENLWLCETCLDRRVDELKQEIEDIQNGNQDASDGMTIEEAVKMLEAKVKEFSVGAK